MKIQIDPDRCQGHARCLEDAPEVFGYDDETSQARLLDITSVDVEVDAVLRAVEGCPESAISVVND